MDTNEPTLLTGRLVTSREVVADGAMLVEGNRIAFAGKASELPAQWRDAVRPAGWTGRDTLLPGLVDAHCHGGAGGEFGPDAPSATLAASHHHRAGTTSLLGSLVSNSHGAQTPAALCDVDAGLLEALAQAATTAGAPRALAQMTFAPERPGAAGLPALLGSHGVLSAVGHTDCDAETAWAALRAGLDAAPRGGRPLVTHVFNGMAPLHHRAPGPVSAALAAAGRGEAVLEVIADGVHLAPATVRMLFDLVGAAGIALVTDAMAASGMPDGTYTLGGQDVIVSGRTARLAEGDSIAGGVATLLDVVR